ncbi:outer membrane factor, OMF family [Fibrobacter sp. UWB15]|uniref:TolC family protein n=1 Tax=unclassified Fibrobacter TaxID=2634177 RepID=UPI0009238F80|nr:MULTISPECIES: TolC family protein [unclassified Fibrobacter]PWJ65000.1 OMF family outer membrane factor [Fibrobacter sp. UWB6]SHG11842.1 outer membrane factor, OMF family [Fibrobacter sp. UWB8]SMG30134.1 outer membrane factor, OMF family [Fibrobacter sp. UWB15]
MPRHLAALSAMALSLAAPQWAGAATYTREEAVKIALEKSSDVKTAEEEVISANSQVDAGYGNALPSIDLDATVTRIFGLDDVKDRKPVFKAMNNTVSEDGSDPSVYDYVNAGAIDGLIYGMSQQGYRWQSSVGLTATQILYAQGKVGTGIEIAKVYKHLKEVNLDNAKANVRYDVENAFDQLIFLDSSIVILYQSKDMLQENLNFVEQGLKSGMMTELDLIRIQLKMDQLTSQINSTEKKRVLARNALLNTMGLEWDSDVKFQGDLRDPLQGYTYPDTSMANVKKRRKELVMLEASEEMLQKNVSIEEGGYKPTLVLVGGLKYTNNKNHFYQWDAPDWDDNINKYIALNLKLNLFNGMKTKEAVVQAKSDLRSTQIKKETAERGFRVQIESCANTLEDANSQIEIAKRQIDLAQKNYDLTNDSYKLGRETQLNLLTAENDLRTAKIGYMQAIVNWNQAYNALLQATGEY